MARILARFTPEMVRILAEMGRFSRPGDTAYLARVLEARLELILRRYLTRLSPLADAHVEGGQLCLTDLARWRELQPAQAYRYSARSEAVGPLSVSVGDHGLVCVALPHTNSASSARDDAPERYERIFVTSSAARGPLVAHVYDLGARGFRVVGLDRPEDTP
jgi:hypothetical protein